MKNDLQFPDNFFGCKLGVRLGRRIIRRHKAGSRPAPDEKSGMRIRDYTYRLADRHGRRSAVCKAKSVGTKQALGCEPATDRKCAPATAARRGDCSTQRAVPTPTLATARCQRAPDRSPGFLVQWS